MSIDMVWLVTGCSAGLGCALARAILAHGHRLIASSRNPQKTPDLVREITRKGGHWIKLDSAAPDLEQIVKDAEAIYGRLDVVVNNAGYSMNGAFEDLSVEKARIMMETNFWGPCKIMQTVIPGMRARKSGTIVNLSSTAGIRVLPTFSYYSATKFALEAMTEGIVQELTEWNIRLLLVEPGAFRTNFLVKGSDNYVPVSKTYAGTTSEKWLQILRDLDGKQIGDPERAAEVIFAVVTGQGMAEGRKEYLRLPLGSDAVKAIRGKLKQMTQNVDYLEDIAASTDMVADK